MITEDVIEYRYLELAKFYKEEGMYEEAIDRFKQHAMLSEDEDKSLIYKEIGICYSLVGEAEKAIQSLKTALEYNKENRVINYLLAQLYEESGDLDHAQFFYEKLLNGEDVVPSVHFQLGEILYKKNDLNGAIKHWEKVVELEPTNSYAYYLLGSVHFYKKEYQKALENLELARKNHYNSIGIYNYIGRTYAKLGKNSKAKLSFTIALERGSFSRKIYKNYVSVLTKEELKSEYEKQEFLIDDKLAKFKLALLYSVEKNYTEAKKMLIELKELRLEEVLRKKVSDELDEILSKVS